MLTINACILVLKRSARMTFVQEIEENEEYVEDEDEFDINKRQSLARGDAEMTDVEAELDILAREPLEGSDEEDAQDSEEPLRQLPGVSAVPPS